MSSVYTKLDNNHNYKITATFDGKTYEFYGYLYQFFMNYSVFYDYSLNPHYTVRFSNLLQAGDLEMYGYYDVLLANQRVFSNTEQADYINLFNRAKDYLINCFGASNLIFENYSDNAILVTFNPQRDTIIYNGIDDFGKLEYGYSLKEQEFDTNLYPELLDNTETESMLKTYINDGDISGYTDKDLEIMRLIEKYNKNVLALRATKKVDVTNTINTSSDSQNIDLSTVNQQLTNINNALHYTNTDDVVKNLTEVVAENDKSILVENNVVESAPYNPHLKKYDLFEG